MKSYSNLNLLAEEYEMLGYQNFLGKLAYKWNKTNNVLLIVEIDRGIYMRAEALCEDLADISDYEPTLPDIINLLYHEYLLYAKEKQRPEAIFSRLASMEEKVGVREFDRIFHKLESKKASKAIDVRMKRQQALRGEHLLADLALTYPNHGYTLEKVLALIIEDFMKRYSKDPELAFYDLLRTIKEQHNDA